MNIITRSYESLLPFLVVEAISSKDYFMSVRIMDQGWAWLVGGRKLIIWKFKESKAPKTRRTLSPCFELQLPQCGLVHRAELVQTFFLPNTPNTLPAALAVSPEGTIRFWSNIANERFTEAPLTEIMGQEFCTLVPLSPLEYVLGTTTGSVFLLTIDTKGILACSSLAAPSGLLSGISRRMTNLFFGPATDIDANTRRPLIAVPKYSQSLIDKSGTTDRSFFVMTSSFKLRQWSRTNAGADSTNHLIRDWDLQHQFQQKLTSALNLSESTFLSFWPIDMIITKSKELLILIVTLDTTRDNTINYATCIFNPYQLGESIASLTILRSHSWHYTNETEDQLLSLKFLERRANSNLCFLYDRKFLFLVKVDEDVLDAIDYGNQDDGVLGAGIVDNHPILFTQRDGLIYVVPVASNRSRMDTMNETSIQLEPPPPPPVQEAPTANTSTQQETHSFAVPVSGNSSRLDTVNESSTQSEAPQPSRTPERITDNPEFQWVHLLDTRQYGLASEVLAKLAQESELLSDRKETLIALSKLAQLAE